MKATLTFKNSQLAQLFARDWARHTLTGHTISSIKDSGTVSVTVYDVTTDRKIFIDEWIENKTQ
jgi:hypothetical protein